MTGPWFYMQKPSHALIYSIHTSPSKDAFNWSWGTTKAVGRWEQWSFHPKNKKIKKRTSRVGNAPLSFVFHPSIFLSYIESDFLLSTAKYDYLSTWIQATLIKRHTYTLQDLLLNGNALFTCSILASYWNTLPSSSPS